MTSEQLAQMRALLERSKQELAETNAMSKQSAKAERADKCAIDRFSRMEVLQSREMAMETERRRQETLRRIEAALTSIDSGDYGRCIGCGEEIDLRRLRFDPTTDRCIKCAQNQ